MTCKRLVGYAQSKDYPFLCIYGGKTNEASNEGSVRNLCLKRSVASFSLDEELAYDPLFQRHSRRVERELLDFRPDIVHITGLNDVSILGSYLGWKHQIPILGSWHTNLHEFAAHRLSKSMRFLPSATVSKITKFIEDRILDGAVYYYKMPKVVLAPNEELVSLLGKGTNREARIMGRGVDTDLYSPEHRTVDDGIFRIGFVGRLRAEKNVRMLIDLEKMLIEAGHKDFEFLIVGEGNEREHLEANMKHAAFTGFLSGKDLSEAYANMDVFVFPSKTDAFGNVTQEAFASGVPSIVSDMGGPKFLIDVGVTGYVASNVDEFYNFVSELMSDRDKLAAMKIKARENAMSKSWDAVFESVYDAYKKTYEISLMKKESK